MSPSGFPFSLRWPLKRLNWANLLFFTLTPLGAMVLVPLYHYFYGWEWRIFFLTLALASMGSVSITAGYHRLLSHRAYESSEWLKLLYLLFGASTIEGSALLWCTDHRLHHRYIDTDKDPYNIKRGFFYAHMGWFLEKPEHPVDIVFPSDLASDRLLQWQHRNYFLIASLMTFVFPTLLGWMMGSAAGGFVYGAVLRVVLNQHSTFLINSFCHMFGTQPYGKDNTAKDSFWMSIFTFGEGYHNFHHHFQSDYRNGVRWFDWDPTKWFIRSMAMIGACYRLKMVPYAQIARARMAMEYEALTQKGVPRDRLQSLKERVEEGHRRVMELYRTYRASDSRVARLQAKLELKLAKIELRASSKQWIAYTKMMDRLSVAT
jgi:stearoyl-CoA desaturase (Delta-9 desaturase)